MFTISKEIKAIKYLWLLMPMQLFIQGQWWSNLSTHWLQVPQCLDLGVRTISQSGHNYTGSMSYINFKKSMFFGFFMKPGAVKAVNIHMKKLATPRPTSKYTKSRFSHIGYKNKTSKTYTEKFNMKNKKGILHDFSTFLSGVLSIQQAIMPSLASK